MEKTISKRALSLALAVVLIVGVGAFAPAKAEGYPTILLTPPGDVNAGAPEIALNPGTAVNSALCGDVNLDGELSWLDRTLIARYSNGLITLTNEQLLNADVNMDGVVNIVDAYLLGRYLSGWFYSLPYLGVFGDVNLDGRVDANDLVLILHHIDDPNSWPLTNEMEINADVYLDGIIDRVDAEIIQQHWLGTPGYEKLPLISISISSLNLAPNQPSQIALRVGQTYKLSLAWAPALAPAPQLTYTANPPGFLAIDQTTGIIKATKAGGLIILVIKVDGQPEVRPVTVVITTQA